MNYNPISPQEMTDDIDDYLDIPTLATPLKGDVPDVVFQNMNNTSINLDDHQEMKVRPNKASTVSEPLSIPSNDAVLEYIQLMMQQANVAEKAAKEALLYEKVVTSLMPSLKKELRLWLNTVLEEESRQLHKAVMQRFEGDVDQLVGRLANIQMEVKALLKQEEE